MTARAVVLQSSNRGEVDLEFDVRSRCAGCAGTCMWRRMDARQVIKVRSAKPLAVGSEVEIGLPERYVLLGSLLIHGLPLAALLIGASLGAFLVGSDLGVLLGAVLGTALAFSMTPWLRNSVERMTLKELTIEPLSC